MKRLNGKLGAKLVRLIAQRERLMVEYTANTRARHKLQCDLDRLTKIAELAGLEPSAYGPGGWLDPLKGAIE